jgi:hypothetical protein
MSEPGSPGGRLPAWRIAAGTGVLGVLGFLGVQLVPVYFRNLELQRFVEETTHRVENQTKPDDFLRTSILQKSAELGLPVRAGNVQVKRSKDAMRVEVRYVVRVDLPLYTVDLHFYPGAGSR